MGKNRRTNNEPSVNEEKTTPQYTTSAGIKITMDKHDEEFFKHLEMDIGAWIKYASASPDFLLTKDELEFVLNHMKDSEGDPDVPSGMLTRVEKRRHFLKHNYKVGDYIDDPAKFRSYSRSQEGTLQYIQRNGDPDRGIVIYRTHGNIKHFKASDYDNTYEWEVESFVEQGKMKITNIHELSQDEVNNLASYLGVANTGDMSKVPRSITVVDVEQR